MHANNQPLVTKLRVGGWDKSLSSEIAGYNDESHVYRPIYTASGRLVPATTKLLTRSSVHRNEIASLAQNKDTYRNMKLPYM